MNKLAFSFAAFASVIVAMPASAATFAVTGDTSAGIPTFNRPTENGNSAPTRLSLVGDAVAYSTFSFAVQQADVYNFNLTATNPGFDTFLLLYANGFNPSSPLTNVIVANDDGLGGNNSFFSRSLQQGIVYTAVVTGYDNLDRGAFSLTIASVTPIPAVPEPATWAMMLVGFGMVGAASRYRRRKSSVRYA